MSVIYRRRCWWYGGCEGSEEAVGKLGVDAVVERRVRNWALAVVSVVFVHKEGETGVWYSTRLGRL